MCNRYKSPVEAAIERTWEIGRRQPWRGGGVYPRASGPFIRRTRHDPDYSTELVVGQWGLIPWFAKDSKLAYSTNNARSEDLASKASFKQPWARGQRCVIPVVEFDEPCWETGRNVWWTFRRTDGDLLGLAGLWNVWTNMSTGEEFESYTMLTINADTHHLMGRMHKPDPKLPPDQQDKRSVIAIEREDVDMWLGGTVEQAKSLLCVPSDGLLVGLPSL